MERGRNGITTRQKQVLELIAEGYANKQIADLLGISRKTVESHREELNWRLGAISPAHLITAAFRAGYLKV